GAIRSGRGPAGGSLYGVSLTGTGTEAGGVEEMRVADCTYGGIRVEGKGHVVRANHVMHTTGTPYPAGNVASISAFGSNQHLVDNDVTEFYGVATGAGYGIWMNACNHCIVEGNRIGNATLNPTTLAIGAGFSEGTMIVGNRIVNTHTGIEANSSTGIVYRDNVTFGCTVPYGTGTDGGNNY